MGQTTSKKSYLAHSYVSLQESVVYPGSIFSGNINIQVVNAINPCVIDLIIRSEEYTEWSEWVTKQGPMIRVGMNFGGRPRYMNQHTVTHSREKRKGRKVTFYHSVSVFRFDRLLSPGQFTIPFSIHLPILAPISFSYNHKIIGRQFYTIKAKFKGSKFMKAISNFIWVSRTAIITSQLQPISCKKNMQVKNCCLFGEDSSMVYLELNKSAFYVNETIAGVVKVDQTKSSKPLKRLTFELWNTIRLKDNEDHSYSKSNCLISENIQLSPFRSDGKINSYTFAYDLQGIEGLWLRPSIESELVKCTYSVRVKPRYDTICSGRDYTVSACVDINNNYLNTHAGVIEQNTPNVKEWYPVVLAPQMQPVPYGICSNSQINSLGAYNLSQ